LGEVLLRLCFALALAASGSALVGSILKDGRWLRTGRSLLTATFVLSSAAVFTLVRAFLKDDFSFRYVASYSSSDLPAFYKLTALWAGQDGSLLFWLWVLCGLCLAFVLAEKRDALSDRALPVLAFVQAFFCLLLVLPTDPFGKLPVVPRDGRGLNPLLQNPWMAFHPPTLYAGYIGFTFPFALGLGGLLSGDGGWIGRSRRWALFSWIFLTLGILTGMKWAYVELGWGGYWSWDPVENASLMPWLTATAFLHSASVRGRTRSWSFPLVVLTFELTMFGTFLTRSGVVSSVHAFGRSPLGCYFLGFIALSGVAAAWAARRGRRALEVGGGATSLLSSEGTVLLGVLVLCTLCIATFSGTVMPILSEALTGSRVMVGPEFFNGVFAPLAILMLVMMGVWQLTPWEGTSPSSLLRRLAVPLIFAFSFTFTIFVLGGRSPYLTPAAFSGGFALGGILSRAYRSLRAGGSLLKCGGHIVHIGVVVFSIGVFGSSLKVQGQAEGLRPGESFEVAGYTFRFEGTSSERRGTLALRRAKLGVLRGEEKAFELAPGMAFCLRTGEVTSEVDVHSGFSEDVYAALLEVSEDGASFWIQIAPMVSWMWLGGYLMLAGAFLSLWRCRSPMAG